MATCREQACVFDAGRWEGLEQHQKLFVCFGAGRVHTCVQHFVRRIIRVFVDINHISWGVCWSQAGFDTYHFVCRGSGANTPTWLCPLLRVLFLVGIKEKPKGTPPFWGARS